MINKKKLREQEKILRMEKYTRAQENKMTKKRKQQTRLTILLEKLNQKTLVKERKLRRYQNMVKQYKQNRTFQNNEKKFTNKSVEKTLGKMYNRIQRKQNCFGARCENRKT